MLTALDSIAWTLNIRGADVAHTPVALAYAIVDADGTADLFVAPEKIDDDGARSISAMPSACTTAPPSPAALGELCRQARRRRSRARGRGDLRRARGGRRDRAGAARPGRAAQGDQEPGRDRRAPRRIGARRRGAGALPALGRDRSAARAARPSCPCAAKLQEFREATGVLRGYCRSTRSRRPARTAPARIIMSTEERTRRSSPASSIWSIRAGNMPTAPPT